ncbi:MAG TPA: enoyl-CoA hydratase-related protein [Acidimicrobiia bacterium]|nr:enoyl-CoA hydratase-related protein [Acidimicrobiia bacterium]
MSTVSLSFDDGVARLTLDRPEAANAIDAGLSRDIRDAVIAIERAPSVGAVLLTGNGKMFCGGGDLKSMSESDDLPTLVENITIDFHAAVSRLARLDAPVVAGVHGAAGGAGMSLVAAADLVVAGESTVFRMGYTAAGLAPDGSSSFYLARVVGLRRAMELALTNRPLDAATAEAWGLVNRVVPDDDVQAEAESLARKLASGARTALAEAKRLLLLGATSALEEAMERESLAIARTAGTADAAEGVRAFIEKRKPVFGG